VGAGAVLLATVGYAIGPLIVKRHLSQADPLGPVTAAMAVASIMLLPFGVADFPAGTASAEGLASLAVLGVVCSALAFVAYFRLIGEVGPSRATVITYVNPVVALALGVAILGEHVTAGAVAGLLLILAGSWLSTGGRLPPGLAALATRVRGYPPSRRSGSWEQISRTSSRCSRASSRRRSWLWRRRLSSTPVRV
jgi:drug/metabolite transporter (DMT)-like permease